MIEIFLQYWEIFIVFFLIAMLYSSVGFGGGSSYIAILAITTLSFTEIRFIALCCNIIVVSGNCFIYYKKKYLNFKKIIPLVFVSVPMAFVGSYVKINQQFFLILLAFVLILASFLMWFLNDNYKKLYNNKKLINISFGGGIGLISGLVGIGGGIFLSPLLHLSKWDTPKKIAATSSFFILVNSIAGLLGQQFSFNFEINFRLIAMLLCLVFIGGQIGNRISNLIFTAKQLKKATAILIAMVGIRILYKIYF